MSAELIRAAGNVPLEMLSRIAGAVAQGNSLPERTATSRLSPVVIIDSKLSETDQENLVDILQTMNSIYAGYYLQCFNHEMLKITNAEAVRLMDSMSTDRSVVGSLANSGYGDLVDVESLTDFPDHTLYSMEHLDLESIDMARGAFNDPDRQTSERRNSGGKDNYRSIQTLNEDSNLAVGKIVEVKIQSNPGEGRNAGSTQEVSVPIAVKLVPAVIRSNDMVEVAKYANPMKSMKERWEGLRSGRLDVTDYLTARDLVENEAKLLRVDGGGLILSNKKRRSRNFFSALASGYASPNAVSSMFVISKTTAEKMEVMLRGQLSKPRTRKRFFESTVAMMLVVVDPLRERFTIHCKGIEDSGTYTMEDIKNASKKAGSSDIDSILKAFRMGNTPPVNNQY